MNRILKNKGRALSALLLSAVLVGTLLIKPVHILLVHHEMTQTNGGHSGWTAITQPLHHDCPICDFEFCSFISQTHAAVPKAAITFAKELAPQTIDCLVNRSSHHFQLRAPPVY
ncbi:MAG: hypothetical protein Q8904_06775 [Bacteroidota bacterium]|nr:hypothetical protein [Bacteroidota bacterium]